LFENAIGGVARPDFSIHGESNLGEGAVPDFVISFALALNIAIIFRSIF
jgi:hypothetical protein